VLIDYKRPRPAGYKEKDLIGIPWLLAFALRADGWYLRQDIIWHKPNPMPESVRDRCTKAHEYIFLLSKSDRYFYQIDEIMEPVATSTIERLQQPTLAVQSGSDRVPGKTNGTMKAVGNTEKRNRRSVWTVATQPYKGAHFATFPPELIQPCIIAGSRPGDIVLDPFLGSGTVAEVSERFGRKWIGCELNPDYAPLQHARTAQKTLNLW
jgi:DNA modification methylase